MKNLIRYFRLLSVFVKIGIMRQMAYRPNFFMMITGKVIRQGKIVFDGSIEALSRMDGFKKQIRVVFKGRWATDEVEKLAQIRQVNAQEVVLEVEPEKAASVATHLFANFCVKDVVIADPPLEKIIESIYYLPRTE